MKILIVEDNETDRKIIRLTLQRHGYDQILEAKDGEEGLILAREQRPDLIISDVLMPRMDGFRFLKALKDDEILKTVPVIFYSAVYTGDKEIRLAESLGVSKFILKPKEPEELFNELEKIIKGESVLPEPKIIHEEEQEFLNKYTDVVAAKLDQKVKELQSAYEEMRSKEEEWEQIFNSVGDAVSLHDKDFNIIVANKACKNLLRCLSDEIKSKKCYALFHDRLEPHELCPKVKLEQTGYPCESEFFEPKLNVWLSVSCFPVKDGSGNLKGVVHIAKDITEKKKMELKLNEERKMFESTFELAAVGIAHYDVNGQILRANRKLCEITGYSKEELFTKKFQDITYPDDLELQANKINKLISGELDSFSLEKRLIRKDGSIIWVKITISLVRKPTGEPDYFISVAEDITGRLKLEEQLRQIQKLESIGTLAGGIAHDFNNVLMGVLGNAEILKMHVKPEDPLTHYINEIIFTAEHGAKLTKQILAFSRKQVLDIKPVDLNEIIKNIQKMLRRLVTENITIETRFFDRELIIIADESQISQVLINLVTNAKDAMPKGGRITVATSYFEMDEDFIATQGFGVEGKYALLVIEDTGLGIDKKVLPHIFEPFFTTKEAGMGTGLGLAVVHGIVSQHGGFINVYSEVGRGTSFKIYLPLAERAKVETKKEAEVKKIYGSETILIAEDDRMIREISVNLLNMLGYKVVEAADGLEAVKKFKESKDKIRLLILDGVMPRLDGKDVFKEIQKISPDIKAIFMSGYTEDIFSTAELPPNTVYIQKPVKFAQLAKMIRELLEK